MTEFVAGLAIACILMMGVVFRLMQKAADRINLYDDPSDWGQQ